MNFIQSCATEAKELSQVKFLQDKWLIAASSFLTRIFQISKMACLGPALGIKMDKIYEDTFIRMDFVLLIYSIL